MYVNICKDRKFQRNLTAFWGLWTATLTCTTLVILTIASKVIG